MADFLTTISSAKDWPESWKDLQTIDSLLRCSICGEFFKNTTFIPSCSHNYCSLCVRRYLSGNSKCPICGVNVQESQLENNRIIDEIVKSFVKIRSRLLEVVKNSCNNVNKPQVKKKTELGKAVKKKDDSKSRFFTKKDKTTSSQPAKSSQKRHRKDSSASDKSSSSHDKWLPTERKKLKRSSFRDSSSDSDDIAIIENPTPKKSPASTSLGCLGRDGKTQNKEEDLVDCPVCGQKMAPTRINLHLDSCLTSKDRKDNLRSTSSQSPKKEDQNTSETSSHVGANSFIPQVVRRKPLNKLVYTLLSNTDLKRKMKEHGLSIKGDRQTLVKRHQEFTIIYNSECSKPKPKSVAEIVRLVEEGERKKNKAVEKRDKLNFDRDQTPEDIDKMKSEYMSQNQNEFTRLINEIRNRKKKDENNSDDSKSNEASTSKVDQTPLSIKKKFALKLLPSDDDTASNSSGADFEPVQKRSNTPRRQLRSSTEKRKTRSSAKIPEEIVEDSCDDTSNTIGDEEEEKECDDPVDPIESCITSATLPDPPSPSLLDDFDEKESNHSNAESSESESMLRPAFGPSSSTQDEIPESPPQADDGNQSEEIEF